MATRRRDARPLNWASVRECHSTADYSEVVTIRRPVVFAVAVSLAALTFVVVGYCLIAVFALGPIPFD